MGCLALTGAVSLSRPLRADTPAENKAAARNLTLEGIQLAGQGKCEEAIPLFERAEALFHAPTILVGLGECQLLLGRLVAGTETLNEVVREELSADAPAAFRDAQGKARALLDEYRPKIAQLTLHVEPAGVTPHVVIDGAVVSSAFVGAPRPSDPGEHLIEISAAGYAPVELEIHLDEGSRESVSVKLEPLADGSGKGGVTGPEGGSGMGQKTWGYVTLGVGAALLGAGAVTGAMAVGKENSLKQSCPAGRCPESERDELDRARSLAGMATVATIGGAVAGVTGLVLLLTSGGGEQQPDQATARNTTPRWSPWVGWNAVGVNGSF